MSIRYRYRCNTEDKNITELRDDDVVAPSKCMNGDAHDFNLSTLVELGRHSDSAILDAEGKMKVSKHYESDDMSETWVPYIVSSSVPTDILISDPFVWLAEGRYHFDHSQTGWKEREDKASVKVVDKDNILGYGAGLIVSDKISDYLTKCGSWVYFRSQTESERMALMAGLYIRLCIDRVTGTEEIFIEANLCYSEVVV